MELRRLWADDFLVDPERPEAGALILIGAQLTMISTLGYAILEACAGWTTLDRIAVDLVRRFGTPEGNLFAEVELRCRLLVHGGLADLR